jgi:hypothetical protein
MIMRNRLINTIGRFASVRGSALPRLTQPSINPLIVSANQVTIDALFSEETTGNFFQYANNPEFLNAITVVDQAFPFTLMASEIGQPIDNYYFRVRATAAGFTPSNFANYSTGQIQRFPVSVSQFQATQVAGGVGLTWISPSEVQSVVIERRTTGEFAEIGTATGQSFTDSNVVVGTTYEYRVLAVPINFNFIGEYSPVLSVSVAGEPQLSAPTGMAFNDIGEGGVEITVFYTGEAGVTYVIERDAVQVYSGLNNVATVSGFVAATSYVMRVKVIKTGFQDSPWFQDFYTYQASEDFVLAQDIPNVELFYKPYYEVLTVTPLGNGTSRIERMGGDAFASDYVGKIFESFRIHKNPATYPATGDNYVPLATTARYATVTAVESATSLIVNFEYNGGNLNSPQATTGTSGQFFADNRIAFQTYINSENRKEEIRFDGVFTMKGFPNCTVAKHLRFRDLNGTKENCFLKFYWSDSFNVSASGNATCPTWGPNFGSRRIFNLTNQFVNIDLCQILPTFFCVPSVQYVSPLIDLFHDPSTTSTGTGLKRAYNWKYKHEFNQMPPSVQDKVQLLMPDMGYSVGGGTHDGTDITAFNIYEADGGWISPDPMNFKAKFTSGVIFKVTGTPTEQADFIERIDLKPVVFNAEGVRWNNNREIEIKDDVLTWFSLANQYWTGGTYGNFKSFNYVDMLLTTGTFRIYMKNGGSWTKETGVNNLTGVVILDGQRANAFDRIPAANDVITLGAGTAQCPPVLANGRINLFGWAAHVGMVVNIQGVNYTVTAIIDRWTNVHPFAGQHYNWWECVLSAPAPSNATNATVVTSLLEEVLDGQFREPIRIGSENDNFGHLCYTDQETNMDWRYVNFSGYIRCTGEYDGSDDLFKMTSLANFQNVVALLDRGNEYAPVSLRRREVLTGNPVFRRVFNNCRMYIQRFNNNQSNVVLMNGTEPSFGSTSFGESRMLNPFITGGIKVGAVVVSIYVDDGHTCDLSGSEMIGNGINIAGGNGTVILDGLDTNLRPGSAVEFNQIELRSGIGGVTPITANRNLIVQGENGESGIRNTFAYPIGTLTVNLTGWTIRRGQFNNSGFTTTQNTADPNYCNFISINGQCLP